MVPPRTYRRRRAVAAGLLVAAVAAVTGVAGTALGALGGVTLPAPEPPGRPAGPAPVVYLVQPGDTFWSIATGLRPGADPRPLVDELVRAHGRPSLLIGDRLMLPVAG